MSQLPLVDVIKHWQERFSRRNPSPETVAATQRVIRSLAQGKPVPAGAVKPDVWDWYESQCCGTFDDGGRLVGMALSLQPTGHLFQVAGRQLYAWCALDALFLPGIIGAPAQVASRCPVSQALIQLTVRPDGIEEAVPGSTVVSVVVPDHTPDCECSRGAGPDSPICSQMHFFRSMRDATLWARDHPGVALLTLDDAWQLVQEVWLSRYRKSIGPKFVLDSGL